MVYRYLPHTADIKVEFQAVDLAQLFGDACQLVRELVAGDGEVRTTVEHRLELGAPDAGELLFRYLREALYLFAIDRFIPAQLTVRQATPTSLIGALRGEPFDPARHETQPEVKAVTRHELSVTETPGGWRAVVVFDL
jgi:SHS2 domain-containing protein